MPGTDVAAVVDRFLEVVRDGDTDGFLRLFTAEGKVDDWGRIFAGSRRIRAWSDEEFIGAQGRLSDVRVETTATTATVVAQWTSRRHTGPSRFVLLVDGVHLQSMTITEA